MWDKKVKSQWYSTFPFQGIYLTSPGWYSTPFRGHLEIRGSPVEEGFPGAAQQREIHSPSLPPLRDCAGMETQDSLPGPWKISLWACFFVKEAAVLKINQSLKVMQQEQSSGTQIKSSPHADTVSSQYVLSCCCVRHVLRITCCMHQLTSHPWLREVPFCFFVQPQTSSVKIFHRKYCH